MQERGVLQLVFMGVYFLRVDAVVVTKCLEKSKPTTDRLGGPAPAACADNSPAAIRQNKE